MRDRYPEKIYISKSAFPSGATAITPLLARSAHQFKSSYHNFPPLITDRLRPSVKLSQPQNEMDGVNTLTTLQLRHNLFTALCCFSSKMLILNYKDYVEFKLRIYLYSL